MSTSPVNHTQLASHIQAPVTSYMEVPVTSHIQAPVTNLQCVPDRVLQRMQNQSTLNHPSYGVTSSQPVFAQPQNHLSHSTYVQPSTTHHVEVPVQAVHEVPLQSGYHQTMAEPVGCVPEMTHSMPVNYNPSHLANYVPDQAYYNHAFFAPSRTVYQNVNTSNYVGAHMMPIDDAILNYVPFGSPNDIYLSNTRHEDAIKVNHMLEKPRIADIGTYNVMKSSVLKQTQIGLEQLKEGGVRANLNTKKASDIELRRLENQVRNHPNFQSKFIF